MLATKISLLLKKGFNAFVAELVDAQSSKVCSERSVGSSPTEGTKGNTMKTVDEIRKITEENKNVVVSNVNFAAPSFENSLIDLMQGIERAAYLCESFYQFALLDGEVAYVDKLVKNLPDSGFSLRVDGDQGFPSSISVMW